MTPDAPGTPPDGPIDDTRTGDATTGNTRTGDAAGGTTDDPVAGSPAWWAARAARAARAGGSHDLGSASATTRRGRGRPALDTDLIVATALRLVDAHGTHAFSLRMLAEALGSGTATLYRHFAAKDEILALVVDRVLGEADPAAARSSSSSSQPSTDTGTPSWQEALRGTGLGLYAVLRAHPHVVGPLMAQVPVGPNGLAQRERVLHALVAGGLEAGLAARAFTAVAHYAIGFVAQQHGPAAAPGNGPELAAFYRRLDPAGHPTLIAAAEALTSVPPEEEFRFGLDLLVRGLEGVAGAAPASTAP
ncbi:TetR/AcrR family transcriptional regulator [Streptomyces sp. NPDC097619]|uniref:TetR/AcrR family transcriptional regulator n=1 Tax=Streptomyces sp. NPDC097619 TaxID=3157228 RepID=UPI00332EBFE5